MKMGLIAESPMDWIALKANMVPMPVIHGIMYFVYCKVLLTASRLDIFEAVKDSSQTIEQIAQKTGFQPKGLESLLKVLISAGYIGYKDGRFGLTRVARKWCLKDSPDSFHNYLRFTEMMCEWMDHLEEYLKTGKGIEIHEKMTTEQWQWYQLGMEDEVRLRARAAPKMTPMPEHPTEMMDIGGSHGLYCVELCKKYPTLKATILELPEAVEKARPILAKFNMGDRINYQAGNVLTDEFGENRYDLILMSSLMHHFSAEQNIEVSKKVAKALKPGGYFVIQEFLRPETSSNMNFVGIVTDILFNLASTSNTWSMNELKDFQQKAGLIHFKVNKYQLPGFVQVCAKKE